MFAAAAALAVFRFPLLVFPLGAGTWFFVTDLISGGGDWSAAGLTIGGGLLWLFHEGDWDWILIGLVALFCIGIGDRLVRSSWVVLGAWALLQTTAHFAAKWSAEALGAFFYLFPFLLVAAFGNTSFGRDTHPWAFGALLRGHRGRLHPHRVAARAAPAHRRAPTCSSSALDFPA